MDAIRIGTRGSRLAMAQARLVGESIKKCHDGLVIEIVPIKTSGDAYRGPLKTVGGKGLFTAELESALREGRIDMAVHSAKDMPAVMADDFTIAAVPLRADARDALISTVAAAVDDLPQGATVATSSPRRKSQLLALRNDLNIVPMRGNVETRMKKVLFGGAIDATVLAVAGLNRSGLLEKYHDRVCPMDVERFTPAAGQGAIAVQITTSRTDVGAFLEPINDNFSRSTLMAERSVVRGLGADCSSPLAVHIRCKKGQWQGLSMTQAHREAEVVFIEEWGESPQEVADNLLKSFRQKGIENISSH